VSYTFAPADVAFLGSDRGAQALAECAQLPLRADTRIADVDAARRIAGEYGPAVLETLLLRDRAAAKLHCASQWLCTDEALQQASASRVAVHRAGRLAGRDVHDVTCSIGGDLVELARAANRCVGSDTHPVRLAMAAHNCSVHEVSPGLLRADALRPTTRDTVVVADPARRDGAGRRNNRPDAFVPPLDELAAAYRGRDLVVKTAPGIDPAAAPWAAELELISLDGQAREACLYSAGVAGASRRASVLRSDGSYWTVTGDEPDDIDVGVAGEWIVDPDPAVVRAGLVRQYGARHAMWQLDERIAYLTGNDPPPGIRAFRVLEFGPYSEKSLRAAVRRHEAGSVEILTRGVNVDPTTLRRRIGPRGRGALSIVITRIGRKSVAFVCRAEIVPEADTVST